MHLPVSRRNHAGFFFAVAACVAGAASLPATALEVASADGRWRLATDEAAGALVVSSGAGTELRRIPLLDRNRRAGRLAWIIDLPRRQSFLAGFEALPEAWELPYSAKADPVYDGLVHDYRMGEGIADRGPLPVRRIPLSAPLPRPTPDERQVHVSWADPAAPGRLNVLNLDVRRIVAQVDQGNRSDAAPPAAARVPSPPPAAPPPAPGNVLPKIEKVQVVGAVSRVEEAVESVAATVSLIERQDAFRDVAGDLRGLLRYEPGVSIENGATRFGLGNIAIRGLDGNRVQMTVDGIRLPESYRVGLYANASRNAMGLGLLKQVEIVRGPASAIHGSDALAGVVAFTTLDPASLLRGGKAFGGEAFAVHTRADGGIARGGAVAFEAAGTQVLVGAERTDSREVDNLGTVGGTGATRTEPNPQSARAESQLVKWIVPTASGWRYTVTADRYARDVATDELSLNPRTPRTVSQLGDDLSRRSRYGAEAVGYDIGPFTRVALTAFLQDSRTQQDTAETRVNTTAACLSAPGTINCLREVRFRYENRERGVVAIGEAEPRWFGLEHRVVAGAEFSRTRATESRDGRQTILNTGAVSTVVGGEPLPARDFPVTDTDRLGAFVQDSVVALDPRLTWIPGVRVDAFRVRPRADEMFASSSGGRAVASLSDEAASPKLGVLFRASEALVLNAQLATGFRAPPAADLNIGLTSLPAGYSVIPNPDLKPETSRGAEFGARLKAGSVEAMATAFYTRYSDLILSRTPLACPADPACVPGATGTFQSRNVAEARIYGIEARVAWRFAKGWTARAAFSAPRGDDTGKDVPLNSIDPPRLVAGVGYEAPRWGAAVHLTHSRAPTRVDRTVGLNFVPPGWTTADLTAWWKPLPSLEVAAGAFNLADRKYWLWSDVRNLTNITAGFDRYTQPGRNYGVNARWSF